MINHIGFISFIKNMMINHNIEINGKRVVNCYIQDFKIKMVYEDGDFIQIKIKSKPSCKGTDTKIIENEETKRATIITDIMKEIESWKF